LNAVDCNQTLFEVAGGTTYLNSAFPCECEPLPIDTVPPDPPVLDVDPTSFDLGVFTKPFNQAYLYIRDLGGDGQLVWNASSDQPWLTLSETSGGGNYERVTIKAIESGLPVGTNTANITVTSNGGDAVIPVTIVGQPVIEVAPPSGLTFYLNQPSHGALVTNDGIGTLQWTVTEDIPWLSIDPPHSGGAHHGLVIFVDRTGLTPGVDLHDVIHFSGNGGDLDYPVTLTWEGALATRNSTWGNIKALYR
jgi:hypothetical protein